MPWPLGSYDEDSELDRPLGDRPPKGQTGESVSYRESHSVVREIEEIFYSGAYPGLKTVSDLRRLIDLEWLATRSTDSDTERVQALADARKLRDYESQCDEADEHVEQAIRSYDRAKSVGDDQRMADIKERSLRLLSKLPETPKSRDLIQRWHERHDYN